MRAEKIVISAFVFILGISSSYSVIETTKIYLIGKDMEIHQGKSIQKNRSTSSADDGNKNINLNFENSSFLWDKGILGKEKKEAEEKKDGQKTEIKEVVLSPLSETYRLMGTLVGSREKLAFIAPQSPGSSAPGSGIILKKLGEEIEPGAVISEIKSDRVEIIRGNRKEILFLFETDEKKFKEQRAASTANPPTTDGASYAERGDTIISAQSEAQRPDLIQIGEDTYEVKRGFIQANFSDMGNILVSARAIPYIKDGAIQGFRLINISPTSFYKAIGLQDGDIIKSINNVPITNPQSILKIMTDIQNETYFEIKVERMGRERTLRYHVR